MSRSRRKPYVTEVKKKWAKRQASKAVRREADVPDGKSFRKVFDPWNITDYRYEMPKSFNKKLHEKLKRK